MKETEYQNEIGRIIDTLSGVQDSLYVNGSHDGMRSLASATTRLRLLHGNIPDVKYIGVPNVCFSLTSKDDARNSSFVQQRIKRGFDDSETWSLYQTIASFIIPRLQRYLELSRENIQDPYQGWQDDLRLVLDALTILKDDGHPMGPENQKVVDAGLKKFSEIFERLWW